MEEIGAISQLEETSIDICDVAPTSQGEGNSRRSLLLPESNVFSDSGPGTHENSLTDSATPLPLLSRQTNLPQMLKESFPLI